MKAEKKKWSRNPPGDKSFHGNQSQTNR